MYKGRIVRVLFDLDGTLFDTQRLHAEVEAEMVRTYSADTVCIEPDEITQRFAGRPSRTLFEEVLGCGLEIAQRLSNEKWDMLMPRFVEATPLANLPVLFEALAECGISIAIGTASKRAWAMHILEHHDLTRYFPDSAIVGGDMVEKGKPHPDIWLKAAGNVTPSRCLVVEDGIAGIDGAEAAGMPAALLVPQRHPYAQVLENLEGVLSLLE